MKNVNSTKLITLLVSCFFVLYGCSKTEVVVQTDTPAPILQLVENYKQINSSGCNCHPYIKQYIWRNKNVYVTGNNDNLDILAGYQCDWIPSFYNSKGERFEIDGSFTSQRFQDFTRTARFIKTVWACE